MTLYYSLTFGLLVFEMAVFVGLIVPMPHALKRRIFTFISESPLIAKTQYWLRITFVFILILFIDSVNRVYRVQVEVASLSKDGTAAGAAVLGSERMEVQARKFYSQRNMYLCGFTLFLSLILNRTYIMILEQLRLEEKLLRLEGKDTGNAKHSAQLQDAAGMGEIGKLKNELAKKDRDLETMKKQVEGLQREYGTLGDRVTHPDPTVKKDR